jgi:transposase-like protein
MHRTKLPLHLWFWAAHLMATHSNGISALQLKAQLGVTYKTAWLLEQKLRRAMVDPDRSKLSGCVEVDQTEMPLRTKERYEGDPETMTKILVIGAVEVRAYDRDMAGPRQDGEPRKVQWQYRGALSGRCRMARIAANSEEEIQAFMRANIEPGTTVLTDGHQSYAWIDREALAEIKRTGLPVKPEYVHEPHVVGKMAAHVLLPWIHRLFSPMKRWSMGTYHGLRRQHVDAYLNEFVFRYNRRRLRHLSFETLLGLAAEHGPTTYWDLTGVPKKPRSKPVIRKRPQRRRTAAGLRESEGRRAPKKRSLKAPGSAGQVALVQRDKTTPPQGIVAPGSQG